jgi:hypothetical protein
MQIKSVFHQAERFGRSCHPGIAPEPFLQHPMFIVERSSLQLIKMRTWYRPGSTHLSSLPFFMPNCLVCGLLRGYHWFFNNRHRSVIDRLPVRSTALPCLEVFETPFLHSMKNVEGVLAHV